MKQYTLNRKAYKDVKRMDHQQMDAFCKNLYKAGHADGMKDAEGLVAVAARVMKKDQQFIRQGIILGFLKFGVAFKKEGSSQYDYYISPMKFWEETGFVYAGEEC